MNGASGYILARWSTQFKALNLKIERPTTNDEKMACKSTHLKDEGTMTADSSSAGINLI